MLNFYHNTVVQFFKSNWAEIRASAAMFIGERTVVAFLLSEWRPFPVEQSHMHALTWVP